MQAMRAEAEEKKLPPIYRGKWADATPEEVQAEMDKGTPFCYRFRVPKVPPPRPPPLLRISLVTNPAPHNSRNVSCSFSIAVSEPLMEPPSLSPPYGCQNEVITIQDTIRGEVSWNTDTLGDFVVLRSNGMPVYNFCVAIDDGLMGITNVIRYFPSLHT